MTVPDFQSLMLPLLRVAGDGQEHTNAQARDALASELGLTEQDRREMLPSGTQRTFDNRVGWALVYLKHAALLRSTGRGRFRVTDRGLGVLENPPSRITNRFLRGFPEFVEWQSRGRRTRGDDPGVPTEDLVGEEEQTPEEAIESSYQHWRQTLAQDLLERVSTCSARFFEQLVLDLLLAMGYGGSRRDAAEAVGQSGDAGIDGIIKEDRLGLDVVYVQAKRWDGTVGRPVVQAFAGSLEGHRARKGVLITTSRFSSAAREYVGRIEKRIVLLDGAQLADLMIDHGIGMSDVATYTVRRVDSDYFEDGT